MIKALLYFLLCIFGINLLNAQDPQFSQYYANSLFLSPSFAGADQSSNATMACRYQWPGLEASYFSSTFSADHYFQSYKSGAGLILNSDIITPANIRSTEIGFVYSFHGQVSKKVIIIPGFQLSFVNRNINFDKLIFASQYDENGFTGGSSNENFKSSKVNYVDISTGGTVISENYWFGFSAHHLSTPNQSFEHNGSPLPVKTSLYGGYKIPLTSRLRKKYIKPDEEKSLTPTLLYKMQGKCDQLDIGIYGQYNLFTLGFWYRGIPVKVYKPERTNNDALIILTGICYKGYKIGYSFDYTLSKLSLVTWGSHEISIKYSIATRKKKKIQKRPVCPRF